MRYKITRKSESGHCCFTHTIVDTEDDSESICECFSEENAITICSALNGGEYQFTTTEEEEAKAEAEKEAFREKQADEFLSRPMQGVAIVGGSIYKWIDGKLMKSGTSLGCKWEAVRSEASSPLQSTGEGKAFSVGATWSASSDPGAIIKAGTKVIKEE
jgi:hypothetical protein